MSDFLAHNYGSVHRLYFLTAEFVLYVLVVATFHGERLHQYENAVQALVERLADFVLSMSEVVEVALDN